MQTPEEGKVRVAFAELIDLAAEKVGGKALIANDEFFAPKENMLKPGRGVFIPDKYTEFGKWMDGWETRRKRVPGYDWCILQLGLPGVIRGVNVDTNHFLGNFPEYASVDGLEVEGSPAQRPAVDARAAQHLPGRRRGALPGARGGEAGPGEAALGRAGGSGGGGERRHGHHDE